ncbi:hypothetical protein RHMOL_Rhmol01G0375900 [Rhododendron molle]|uniref:Uncharacterized protein n=1 Tax=Rhododendron molle TaxID=49168 RepID=A0ACC0QB72_RHOML|nr:hypothetical protein RHMOL_Rhmol01G0375900 [Rhododendron molle]
MFWCSFPSVTTAPSIELITGCAIVIIGSLHRQLIVFLQYSITLDKTPLVKDALSQFGTALTLDPNPLEAQAALYNKACCHAYRLQVVILRFPSHRVFHCFCCVSLARLGGEDIGYSFRRDLKLISEVQAPFREVRRFFYVAFSAAAGISLFFTVPRLIRAIHGGDDAPDVLATAENAAINVGGIIIFVALFFWDNKKEEEQLAQTSRNETLSRWMEDQQKSEGVTPGEDVYIILRLDGRVRISGKEIDFRAPLLYADTPLKSEGVTPGEDVYIILSLDGRVRRSGKGMPDWQQIVKELPPMEALLSKL